MNLMSKTVILGAGVDSLSGIAMPLTSELIPQISDFVQTVCVFITIEQPKLIRNIRV